MIPRESAKSPSLIRKGHSWRVSSHTRTLPTKRCTSFHTHTLRDEPCGALTCFVLERMPRKESAYEKQVVWVDGAEYRVQKAELYGKAGIVVKTITVSGYQKVKIVLVAGCCGVKKCREWPCVSDKIRRL